MSHCLGSPSERNAGVTWGVEVWRGPKLLYGDDGEQAEGFEGGRQSISDCIRGV